MINEVRIERESLLLATRVSEARTFFSRFFGLLGRRSFHEGEALILRSTRQVHMFFMKFSIDIVFCRGDGLVLHLQSRLKPWQVSAYIPSADYVVEFPTGTIEKFELTINDRLLIS